jgi:protein TonB
VGQGVNPPRVTFQRDPEFSERAKEARVQGTVTLTLLVNTEGVPTNIHIASPLGYSLDEKAVQTVEAWRFKPAE